MSQRFHVHVHVDNLDKSIACYERLFAALPRRRAAGRSRCR